MYKILRKLFTIKQHFLIAFLLLHITQLSYAANRQEHVLDKRISISVTNMPLKEVLEKISALSSVGIVFSNNKDLSIKVSERVKDKSLRQVLDDLFNGLPFSYQVIDDKIVISHREKKSVGNLPGQNKFQVRGKVINQNGQALPGATIHLKNGELLAITNLDGGFILKDITEDVTVLISFTGYDTKEVTIHSDTAYLEIVLQLSSSELGEVKVLSNGYQQVSPERATGSYTQPIKEMFDDRVSTDVLSKLNGITSGLLFNANTGTAGADISIRGRSTIFANDQPLIVVDNFPYSGDINNINPNDVESVTVLKDAAAASIWGVRAGNGVIVITMKKGRLNHPLKVSFNSNLTIFNKPELNYNPNQLSSASYIELERYLFRQGFYDSNLNNTYNFPVISPAVQLLAEQRAGAISGADLDIQLSALGKINLNDQLSKYFFQHAVNQQYAVNFSGGSEKAIYYFSAGYDQDLSNLKDNSSERITINTQNTFFPVKNFEITVGLNVVQSNNKIDNTYSITQSKVFPYTEIADNKGNALPIAYGYNQTYTNFAPENGFLDWSYSPLKQLGEPDDHLRDNNVRFTTGLKYNIISGLSAEIKYQYENAAIQNRDFESQNTYYTRNLINEYAIVNNGQVTGFNIPLGGILAMGNSNTISNNVRGQLNYTLNWKNSNLSALAGYELSQVSSSSNSSTLYGYDNNNATFTNIDPNAYFPLNPGGYAQISSGNSIGGTVDRIRSSFANAAYTYMGKYTLSSSARIDGSNYFGVATQQKTLPLWSTGLKWVVDKETFYHVAWLPQLDFRGTYGYNGNLDRSVTGVTTLFYQSNDPYTTLPYSRISNVGNPDLRWEKTGIANLAVDFGLKNNVLTGSIEYYIKKETDLLGYKTFPENSGITSLEGNYADMTGHGFDLVLNSQIFNKKFKWFATVLFSHATDKVTRYGVTQYPNQVVASDGNGISATPLVGKPVFGIYSYKWGGLDPVNGNPIGYLNSLKSEDYSDIDQNTPIGQLIYSGAARPTYFGGFNNHFSYKGLSLDIQVNYKLGYYFRKPSINYYQITSTQSAYLSVNRQLNQRWMKPGDEKTTNVPSLIYPFDDNRSYFYEYSSVNVDNGSHIRLQDISLSYMFNKSAYPGLPFNSLQLFVYANNVAILWRANHDGLDPDAVPSEGNTTTTPSPRSFSVGIKGTFN